MKNTIKSITNIQISLDANKEFEITTRDMASAGYLMQLSDIPKGIELISSEFENEIVKDKDPLKIPIGSMKEKKLKFKALASGQYKIVITHFRPFHVEDKNIEETMIVVK